METTKKRKRDIDLPRIVYDATTRVFDRLFKEDSLEGMKDVVRKKLGVPSSTPVQLAQLRDGQTVDLEDDDDFEAFSSSAYKSSTAKVKVIVGSGTSTVEANGVPPFPQTPDGSEKKKKKKSKDKKDQHRAVTPQTTPSESPPPSKKRRVSFVEPSAQINKEINKVTAQWDRLASLNASESTPEQESTQLEENVDLSLSVKQKKQERKKERRKEMLEKAVEVESSKETTPVVQDDTPQANLEKEKKKKRKKEKKAMESAKEDELTVTPEPQPVETVDKPAKSKSQKVNGITDASTDDTAAAKKSKKRSRATETDSMDKLESGKATTPNSSTEPPPETENTEEASRSAKKQKHAHKDGAGADGANKKSSTKETNIPNAAEVPPPKTSKKSKIKSPAIIASEDSDSETAAPSKKSSGEVNAPTSTKKARRKSDAHPSAPITPAEKQPTKKSNDPSSQSKDTPPVVLEAPAPTEKAAAKPKLKKNSDATPTAAEAKTPKKVTKKADTSEPTEDAKAATKAAVAAILARKLAATAATQPSPDIALSAVSAKKTAAVPASSSAQTTAAHTIADPALLQISSDESISAAVLSSAKAPEAPESSTSKKTKTPSSSAHILAQAKKTVINGSTALSASAKKPAKTANPSKCLVCGAVPWHIQSKCPTIKSGIRAMRKRIGELELELASGDEDNDNEGISAIIAELRVQIEKKTKKPRAAGTKPTPASVQEEESTPAVTSPAVKSVDASRPSIEVNIVSSSAARPLLPDAEAEPLSARAAPSTGPLPSTPAPSTQSRKSLIPAPSSTQPTPSIRPLYTTQPLSATQPSHSNQPSASQPPLLSHKEPKKSRPSMPPPKPPAIDLPIFPSLGNFALAATNSILGFAGDVSAVSDHDLEELMRGPKITSQDVPSEDDDDVEPEDDQQEPDAILEEDVVDVPAPKHATRMEYPSSSDEEGEDEEENTSDDVAASATPATVDSEEVVQVQHMTGAAAAEPTSTPRVEQEEEEEENEEENEKAQEEDEGEEEEEEEEEEREKEGEKEEMKQEVEQEKEEGEEEMEQDEQAGQKSFQEMNLSSSSRSSGKAGDAAVNDAVSADLALPSSTSIAPSASTTIPHSDEEIAKELGTFAASANPEFSSSSSHTPPNANDHAPDPIEADDDDEQPGSPPEAILSADDDDVPPPKESTPKIALRTRSQRTKSASQPPAAAIQTRTRSKDQAASASQPEPAKTPGRKTRGNQLTKISELPVPIPPASVRVIRMPAQSQTQTPAPVPAPAPTPRATRQRGAAMSEPPAPVAVATRGRKAAAAAITAAAQKTTTATTRTGKAAADDASAVKLPLKAVAKQAATRVAANVRTRASRLTADLESAGEEDKEEDVAPVNREASLASWDVLPEPQSGPSQNESEPHGTADVDELISSPAGGGGQKTAAQEDPLFMYAESQMDLPYSQYPLPTSTQPRARSVSPNDSDEDDADEVAATVVRSRQSTGSQFRSLTEITSQRRPFAPRYSSQLVVPSSQMEPEDMFGRGKDNGEDDESEQSESESEGETPVPKLSAAHFPQTRLAGVSVPPRRR